MFEVGIVAQFEAAHRLHGDFGPATRTHGHTYRVEVSVRGAHLHEDGTLFDISILQEAVGKVTSALHYRDLDEVEWFAGLNTTAETVARVIAERIRPALDGAGLDGLSVRVWESPEAYAGYEVALGASSA